MGGFRPHLALLLVASAACSLSRGDEDKLEGFWVLPRDSRDGVALAAGGKSCWVQKVDLDALVTSCRIISRDNDNTRYAISIKPVPSPYEAFIGLILRGDGFTILSSGYGGTRGTLGSIAFHTDSTVAAKVARAFGARLEKRGHPGHRLRTRFRYDEEGDGARAILEITNIGEKPVIFVDGGMNRGMRNNQFSFSGSRNNRPLQDIGSPVHFGGKGVFVTLKKGERFEKPTYLWKWFDVSRRGSYDIIGTYRLSFYNSLNDYRIVWEDYVASRFTFTRE